MTQTKGSAAKKGAEAKPESAKLAAPRSRIAAVKTRSNPRLRSTTSVPAADFPIVGVGASAGGLEALELFLGTVAPDSGLAFVIVQHLDPSHKDMLVELLQRHSPIPVVQITDQVRVEPDHVYVIPPNRDLSILHGVLHLLEPSAPRGLRLPIDFFFCSLAEDLQERSLAVILSGMGSDGVNGARAIKGKGGAVFVQTSAKYDSMPRSVLDAGLADGAAEAEELAGKLCAFLQHTPLLRDKAGLDQEDKDQSGLGKVIVILRSRTGHDFSLYKKSTLYRRVERRMALHQISKIADYVRYLRENHQESDLLFRELLIGVTNFFRDPEVWVQLKSEAIPALLAARPNGGVLRAWCPGCSTGEEAYSLAMVFREAVEQADPGIHYSLQIFATDLDKDAIEKARVGAFKVSELQGISESRLKRFFAEDEGGYRVNKEIREMVIFAPQNLVMDPPFTKLDLLVCRNLLIYLEGGLQKRLVPLFHYSLNPGGLLVLGSSETVGQAADLFAPLPGKTRIFKRLETDLRADQVVFPSAFASIKPHPHKAEAGVASLPASRFPMNLQSITDSLLLQHYSPAAVLTTSTGDIVYFSGKTGRYLEPPAGKANLNLFAMSREGLRGPLSEAFPKAVREKATVTLKGIHLGIADDSEFVDVTVQALTEPADLLGMVLVVFTDLPPPSPGKPSGKAGQSTLHAARLNALSLELQQTRDEMQTAREEMQSSQEELKSANEELQSTNEELQSTNEELTTSKEELHSMNEELHTINQELQAKVSELSKSKDDMLNLLNSTNIATLFLDLGLKVRRFTPQTTTVIKLIPGDAGRPITDLVTELDYPELTEDASQVLRTLAPIERQISAKGRRWFTVRVMPYRTQDNRIDGVVMTFVDISTAKLLEASLREALSVMQNRSPDQTRDLEKISELESALRDAQASMEKRPKDQSIGVDHLPVRTPKQTPPKK